MPHFSPEGNDMVLCQVCGKDIDTGREEPKWMEPVPGMNFNGNVCPSCVKHHEVSTVKTTVIRAPMQSFKDAIAKIASGITASEAQAKHICLYCKKAPDFTNGGKVHPTTPHHERNMREYNMSATCPACWDKMWEEPKEESECKPEDAYPFPEDSDPVSMGWVDRNGRP